MWAVKRLYQLLGAEAAKPKRNRQIPIDPEQVSSSAAFCTHADRPTTAFVNLFAHQNFVLQVKVTDLQFKSCDPGEFMQKMLSVAKECDRSYAEQVTFASTLHLPGNNLPCSKLFQLVLRTYQT